MGWAIREKRLLDMVSDIKGFDPRQISSARKGETEAVRNETRSETGKTGAATRSDTVELSGTAELVRAAAHRLAAGAPVNEARVQEVKQAIADGSYTVDPVRIAHKLIDADTRF